MVRRFTETALFKAPEHRASKRTRELPFSVERALCRTTLQQFGDLNGVQCRAFE